VTKARPAAGLGRQGEAIMRIRHGFLMAAVSLALAAAPALAMAADYLKLEGVSGDSTDARHQGWIEVSAFSADAAMANRDSTERHENGARIEVTVSPSRADAALMQAASSRKVFREVVLESVGHHQTVKYTLRNVVISAFRQAGDDKSRRESMTFDFQSIDVETTRD
jgi:type VI protein secretion system component Hcp